MDRIHRIKDQLVLRDVVRRTREVDGHLTRGEIQEQKFTRKY